MARQGAGAVVVCDINDGEGRETVALARGAGAEALYLHCDLADATEVRSVVDVVVDRFGGLDVLHNNAGVHESQLTPEFSLEALPVEVFDRVYAINLRGPWLMMKYAAPHLRRSVRNPAIVNAASTGGLSGSARSTAYGATKGGLIQLTRCAAVELAPEVRVNCYAPGSVYTPMIEGFIEAAPDKDHVTKGLLGSQLIPRFGRPEEIAKLVCYLASDDAAWITGTVFPIDGGRLCWSGAHPRQPEKAS
jgi:NAD(P)-dependent dehydrogenase (short-subunit alcohol dehydrogenase family)